MKNRTSHQLKCSVPLLSYKERVVAVSLLFKTVSVLTEGQFLLCVWGGFPGNAAAILQSWSLVFGELGLLTGASCSRQRQEERQVEGTWTSGACVLSQQCCGVFAV